MPRVIYGIISNHSAQQGHGEQEEQGGQHAPVGRELGGPGRPPEERLHAQEEEARHEPSAQGLAPALARPWKGEREHGKHQAGAGQPT